MKTVPLPLRQTEATDMIETQQESSRAHVLLPIDRAVPGCKFLLSFSLMGDVRLGRSAVTKNMSRERVDPKRTIQKAYFAVSFRRSRQSKLSI